MLHDNDLGSVVADDILGVNQGPRQKSTYKSEDQEANVGTIGDCLITLDIDVLAKRDLQKAVLGRRQGKEDTVRGHTKAPMTAPRLNIIQNHEM